MNSQTKRLLISPILLLAALLVIALALGKLIGVWVWVPICLVYWTSMATISYRIAGKEGVCRMFASPKGNVIWPILTLVLALALVPIQLIPNLHVFSQWWVLLLTIIVALCNSFIEEIYWRGIFADFVTGIPIGIKMTISSVFFSLIHLSLAVNSIAGRYPPLYLSLIMLGILWSITYYKTKSLRWPVLTHFMIDIFTLSVPVFLNIYIPLGMG